MRMTSDEKRAMRAFKAAQKTGAPFTKKGDDYHAIFCAMHVDGRVGLRKVGDHYYWSFDEGDDGERLLRVA